MTNHKLDTDSQVFFYEQDFYVLSNFSAFNIFYRGHDFDTSEQAYHWAKFAPDGYLSDFKPSLNEDMRWYGIRSQILQSRSAHDAFKIAERHNSIRRPDWLTVRTIVMKDILRVKSRQHEYVRRKLLATGDRELIEDSWRDDFWGCGENKNGQNMLGKLWMEVRAELQASVRNSAANPAATTTE